MGAPAPQAASNRLMRLWTSHEQAKKHYRRLFIGCAVLLGLSLLDRFRMYSRELDVIRVGGDGVAQVVRLDRESYSEPNELEIRAFAAATALHLCRSDSWSVVSDYTWVAKRMVPRLRAQFSDEAKGTADKTGAIAIIESLHRRTDIEPSTLNIDVNKTEYPWKVVIEGERRILRESGPTEKQPFKLHLGLVRGRRSVEFPEGLLIWEARTEGAALTAPVAPASDGRNQG